MSNIQWFPGHMAKAKRLVCESLKLVDVVIELLDARIPISSRNPMINEILGSKPRSIVLNKSDLADPVVTSKWQQFFKTSNIECISVNSVKGQGVSQIPTIVKNLACKGSENAKRRGFSKIVKCMVVGIPNIGKSSLINRLSKRKSAKTADKPGVTKGKQWIKMEGMMLLDTPGILWPKFDDPEVGMKLAVTGAIKEQVLDIEQVALYLLNVLYVKAPNKLMERYKLDKLSEDRFELLNQIGKKRGLLLGGGVVDTQKAAVLLLKEYRSGKLGAISLEEPEDIEVV